MSTEYLTELLGLMERYSFKRGEFVLASGKKSSFYYDGKAVTLSPRGHFLIGHIVFDAVQAAGAEAVGGLTAGADAISSAVAYTSELKGKRIPAFFVRDQQKTHGTKEVVYQAYSDNGQSLISKGRRVAIVDDVMTTGTSIRKAITEVEERGCKVVLVLTLVDRCDPEGDEIRHSPNYSFQALFSADSQGRVHVNGLPTSAAV